MWMPPTCPGATRGWCTTSALPSHASWSSSCWAPSRRATWATRQTCPVWTPTSCWTAQAHRTSAQHTAAAAAAAAAAVWPVAAAAVYQSCLRRSRSSCCSGICSSGRQAHRWSSSWQGFGLMTRSSSSSSSSSVSCKTPGEAISSSSSRRRRRSKSRSTPGGESSSCRCSGRQRPSAACKTACCCSSGTLLPCQTRLLSCMATGGQLFAAWSMPGVAAGTLEHSRCQSSCHCFYRTTHAAVQSMSVAAAACAGSSGHTMVVVMGTSDGVGLRCSCCCQGARSLYCWCVCTPSLVCTVSCRSCLYQSCSANTSHARLWSCLVLFHIRAAGLLTFTVCVHPLPACSCTHSRAQPCRVATCASWPALPSFACVRGLFSFLAAFCSYLGCMPLPVSERGMCVGLV